MTPPGIKELPNGQWVLEDDTHISRWSETRGNIVSDPHLMRFLDPHLATAETVWDIGAFIGDHTRHYLDRGKKVIAVEPNPLAFQCLAHNCPEANISNCAASDMTGHAKFIRMSNAGASRINPRGTLGIWTARMEDCGYPDPQFIKIDVEGWELRALAGMERILRKCKPILFIEVNHGALAEAGFKAEDLLIFLYAVGYGKHTIYPPKCVWADPQFDILVES